MLQKLNTKRGGFTLVEIMIVVAIIALLAAIAVPNFLRSRKRSQATHVLEDFRIIDAAIDQYAIENGRSGSMAWDWPDVILYVKKDTRLYAEWQATGGVHDIIGGTFDNVPVIDPPAGGPPRLSVSASTFGALSDVAPASFWSPFIQ